MKPTDETERNCSQVNRQIIKQENCSLKIDGREWLSSDEAADYLRISVGTLRNLTSQGKIPYFKFGNMNRYRRQDLQMILLKNPRGVIK